MDWTTLLAGSRKALRDALDPGRGDAPMTWADADVVVVPTAGAFSGLEVAATALARVFEGRGARVEALMIAQRRDADDGYFAARVASADVVALTDGSPLHAMSVWRTTAVGSALSRAARLIAVGSVATVLGEVMIDPRGGAPTNGLSYRRGLAVCVSASDAQLERTRTLLGDEVTLAAMGPDGVLVECAGTWRASGDVVVTRGARVVQL